MPTNHSQKTLGSVRKSAHRILVETVPSKKILGLAAVALLCSGLSPRAAAQIRRVGVPPVSAPPAVLAPPALPAGPSPFAARADWLSGVPTDEYGDGGGYLYPNENNSRSFAPALAGKKGALLSVGTFRALNDAALGDFSHAILFDFDHRTVRFNQANVDLIGASQDRFEYLAALLDRPLDPSLAASVRAGRMADKEFIGSLVRTPRYQSLPSFLEKIVSLIHPSTEPPRLRQARVAARDIWDYAADNPEFLSGAVWYPKQWESTYYGSDRLFSELRDKIKQGRVRVVAGDLAGSRTLKAVGSALNIAGVRFSVIDISNAWTGFPMSPFIANLEALPLAPDAALLFTVSDAWVEKIPNVVDDFWVYFAAPARSFISSARAALDRERWSGMIPYARKRIKKSDPSLRDAGLIAPRLEVLRRANLWGAAREAGAR